MSKIAQHVKLIFESMLSLAWVLKLCEFSFQEIEYKVVKFIPNPYYDDHFDIRSDRFLLGKTLNMIGKTTDDVMGRSCQLIGWGLYEKFDKGLKLLQDFLASDQEYSVTQDAVRMVNIGP